MGTADERRWRLHDAATRMGGVNRHSDLSARPGGSESLRLPHPRFVHAQLCPALHSAAPCSHGSNSVAACVCVSSSADVIASQLELHRLATGQEPRVNTAMTRLKQKLFQYQVR